MIYLVVALVLCISIYLYDIRKLEKGRNFVLILTGCLLVGVSGLSYHLGVDWVLTESLFNRFDHGFRELIYHYSDYITDIGFVILTFIISKLTDNYAAVQLFVAAVLTTSVILFFKRYTRHLFTAIFCYYLFSFTHFGFNVLREDMAVALFLFAWRPLTQKRFGVYYLLVVLAFTMHFSAFVTWFVPLLRIEKIRNYFLPGRRFLYTGLITLLVVWILIEYAVPVMKLLPQTMTVRRLIRFYGPSFENGCHLNIKGIIGQTVCTILIPLIAILLNLPSRNQKDSPGLIPIVMVSVCISIIALFISPVKRFNDYFIFFIYSLVGSISFSRLPGKAGKFISNNRTISVGLFILLLCPKAYLQIKYLTHKSGKYQNIPAYRLYYPYNSYMSIKKDAERDTLDYYLWNYSLTAEEEVTLYENPERK